MYGDNLAVTDMGENMIGMLRPGHAFPWVLTYDKDRETVAKGCNSATSSRLPTTAILM